MKTNSNIVMSELSKRVSKDGVVVDVQIFRLEDDAEWVLEVINSNGTSTTWDEPFPSEEAAFAEFTRVATEEGIEAFLDDANVVPLRR